MKTDEHVDGYIVQQLTATFVFDSIVFVSIVTQHFETGHAKKKNEYGEVTRLLKEVSGPFVGN